MVLLCAQPRANRLVTLLGWGVDMRSWLQWAGLALLGSACAAQAGSPGGASGSSGFGGAGGYGGSAAVGGSAGTAGYGGTGGVAGYGGTGGVAGYGGYGGAGGSSGVGGLSDGGLLPTGDACVPGVQCGPTTPDGNDCGTLTLNAEVEETVTPGNLLVIFDRSASMGEMWGTGPKWQVAKDALATALTPIADRLTVGAILFPTEACVVVGGSVAPITDQRQINFLPGPQFLQAWSTYWANNTLVAGTPVSLAFDAAAVSLASASLTGTTAVVLFTDGQPTDVGLCPAYQKTSVDRAAELAAMGIKTYVVGLPGAAGVQVLKDIAVSGQTMDYITPDDPAVLSQRLASIATSTISVGFNSCSISLNPVAAAPDELQLVVTENGMELGVDRDLGASGGWSITPDGAQVEITGQLCNEMQSGRFSAIKFKFGCVDLPPLPPPPIPD